MKNLYWLILIVLLLNPIFAAAQPQLTASEMLAICKDHTQEEKLVCNAYMQGFLDGIMHGSTLATWNVSGNQNVSYNTVKDSFVNILKSYPVLGNMDVGTVMIYGLQAQGLVTIKSGVKPLPGAIVR